jgi:SAM-dependent methyltransferase
MHASPVEPGQPGYSDAEAAALYNVLNPWGASDDFYLGLVMQARSALDVGCGTGVLLHHARDAGHRGRLCGVDPDPAMLAIARQRGDVEWEEATAAAMRFAREFELAVMTGHAFQVLIADDEVRASLQAVRHALIEGGRFAFETRNPRRRAWESWDNAQLETTDQKGRKLLVWYDVEEVVGDVVTLTETTGDPDRVALRVDRGSLRFLSVEALDSFLAETGFAIEERFGGWRQEPLQEDSEEIVTVARAVDASALAEVRGS